jgi:hypothetical protein
MHGYAWLVKPRMAQVLRMLMAGLSWSYDQVFKERSRHTGREVIKHLYM